MTKCTICNQRPAKVDGFCVPCSGRIQSDRNRRKRPDPRHFLTYRGHVVGLFPNGDGMLKAYLLRRNPERLPIAKTVNLDNWCNGFSRDRIKEFKACVLKLAHA